MRLCGGSKGCTARAGSDSARCGNGAGVVFCCAQNICAGYVRVPGVGAEPRRAGRRLARDWGPGVNEVTDGCEGYRCGGAAGDAGAAVGGARCWAMCCTRQQVHGSARTTTIRLIVTGFHGRSLRLRFDFSPITCSVMPWARGLHRWRCVQQKKLCCMCVTRMCLLRRHAVAQVLPSACCVRLLELPVWLCFVAEKRQACTCICSKLCYLCALGL